MKKIASLILSLALASSVFAGAPAYSGKGGKIVNPPAPSCDWFAPGAKFGVFGSGFLPTHDAFEGGDALGGGVLAEYFFTENFGVEGSYSVSATDSEFHNFEANLIARYPIKSSCWAPYALIGGSYHVDGIRDWAWQVGGGIEAHLTGKMGIFADGAYHFEEDHDRDFTLVRLGLKFRL